jgi:hypothetical protein
LGLDELNVILPLRDYEPKRFALSCIVVILLKPFPNSLHADSNYRV